MLTDYVATRWYRPHISPISPYISPPYLPYISMYISPISPLVLTDYLATRWYRAPEI